MSILAGLPQGSVLCKQFINCTCISNSKITFGLTNRLLQSYHAKKYNNEDLILNEKTNKVAAREE